MIWASTKELYAMFADCCWWKTLSRRKRKKIGRCEECGSRKRLSSHHIRYPQNWFDTTEADLRVLCWTCHEKKHPEQRVQQPTVAAAMPSRPKPPPVIVPVAAVARIDLGSVTMQELHDLRGARKITRAEFTTAKKRLQEQGATWWRNKKAENSSKTKPRGKRKRVAKEYDARSPWHVGMYEGIAPAQVAAQVGTTLPEVPGKHGRTYRVHRWGAKPPITPAV